MSFYSRYLVVHAQRAAKLVREMWHWLFDVTGRKLKKLKWPRGHALRPATQFGKRWITYRRPRRQLGAAAFLNRLAAIIGRDPRPRTKSTMNPIV
jgi:hypothetical protein